MQGADRFFVSVGQPSRLFRLIADPKRKRKPLLPLQFLLELDQAGDERELSAPASQPRCSTITNISLLLNNRAGSSWTSSFVLSNS